MFTVGDLIFSRVPGHPPWPSRVTSVQDGRCQVFFFGTYEVATVSNADVWPYNFENLDKFKGSQIAFYQVGLKEIAKESEVQNPRNSTSLKSHPGAKSSNPHVLKKVAETSPTISKNIEEEKVPDFLYVSRDGFLTTLRSRALLEDFSFDAKGGHLILVNDLKFNEFANRNSFTVINDLTETLVPFPKMVKISENPGSKLNRLFLVVENSLPSLSNIQVPPEARGLNFTDEIPDDMIKTFEEELDEVNDNRSDENRSEETDELHENIEDFDARGRKTNRKDPLRDVTNTHPQDSRDYSVIQTDSQNVSSGNKSTFDPSWKAKAEDLIDEKEDRKEDIAEDDDDDFFHSFEEFSRNYNLHPPEATQFIATNEAPENKGRKEKEDNVGAKEGHGGAVNDEDEVWEGSIGIENKEDDKVGDSRAEDDNDESGEEDEEDEDTNVENEDSETDDDDEGEIKYSKEELAALDEINLEELDEDVDQFLKDTENVNTRDQTNSIVAKYNRVMSAVAKKEGKDFVPLDSTPLDDLPKLLARFFKLIRKKNGEIFNASSYTTYKTCIDRHIADKFNIDIKRDLRFKMVTKTISRLKSKAQATKGKQPGANASRVIPPRYLQLARAKKTIGHDNPDALATAAYLAFTTGLGCRAVNEVVKVVNEAVIYGPINPKTGVPDYIELEEQWVCKNRSGNDPRILEAKITADNECPEICMVRTLMEMQRRKTNDQKAPTKRFFWNVNPSAKKDPNGHEYWYKNQNMGKGTVGKLLIKSLQKVGIDTKKEKITATSARKVLLDTGLDQNIPEVLLGKIAGQKTKKAKDKYIKLKDESHRAANIAISRAAAGVEADYVEILKNVRQEDRDKIEEIKRQDLLEEDEMEVCASQAKVISEYGSVEIYSSQVKRKSSRKTKDSSQEENKKSRRVEDNNHEVELALKQPAGFPSAISVQNELVLQKSNQRMNHLSSFSSTQKFAAGQVLCGPGLNIGQQMIFGNQAQQYQINLEQQQLSLVQQQQQLSIAQQQQQLSLAQIGVPHLQLMQQQSYGQNFNPTLGPILGAGPTLGPILGAGPTLGPLLGSGQLGTVQQQSLGHLQLNNLYQLQQQNAAQTQLRNLNQLQMQNVGGTQLQTVGQGCYQQNLGQAYQQNQGHQGYQQNQRYQQNQGHHQGFHQDQGHLGYQQNQGHLGYQQNQGQQGYQQNQGRLGYQQNQGHLGYQQNQGNLGYQQYQGHQEHQQNQGHFGYQQNQGHQEYQQNQGHNSYQQYQGHHGCQQNQGHVHGQMQSVGQDRHPPLAQSVAKEHAIKEQKLIQNKAQMTNLMLVQNKEQVPNLVENKEQQPNLVQNKEQQPNLVQNKEHQLKLIQNKEQQPNLVQNKEQQPHVPNLVQNKEHVPNLVQNKEQQPNLVKNKEQQPNLVQNKENVPNLVQNKEQLPNLVQNTEQLPKPVQNKEHPNLNLINDEENLQKIPPFKFNPHSIIQNEKQMPDMATKEARFSDVNGSKKKKSNKGNVEGQILSRNTAPPKENLDRQTGSIMIHKMRSVAWPVKIIKIETGRIEILYYGTNQTGYLKGWSNLFQYTVENKAKFGLHSGKIKKTDLQNAFEEAEKASIQD